MPPPIPGSVRIQVKTMQRRHRTSPYPRSYLAATGHALGPSPCADRETAISFSLALPQSTIGSRKDLDLYVHTETP